MTRELSKAYEPGQVETRLYRWWEDSGFFHADPADPGEPYAIAMPPPNVTGSLHLGHAMYVVQDALLRRARMLGRNAVWLPGMDHAGIATQNVVEKELAQQGLSRYDLGREAFLERVWQWKQEYGGRILAQLRRLGFAADWEREAFTLDERRSRAVRQVFCDWYERGLIYRGYRLINWCPRCTTALSDIEVDHVDTVGELAHLRYPAADGGAGVVVATTRAETMLGDTAVAVHPDDERYAHLVGTMLRLPLAEREIPVVADAYVDPDFGTGAVKITPAHDPNDYAMGQRHDLPAIDIMTETATISAAAGRPYEGLDRYEARRKVKEDLEALGLLVGVEERTSPVGHCSRCGTVVEPRLSDQWFVAVESLADKAIAAVRDGRTRIVPERNTKGFLDWLENLHDWTISRQLWWGHRIPAWYDTDGGIHVLREDPSPQEVAERGLVQDPDVLDTWFSSQLWPFTTLGWPERTPELDTWYPNAVLETGYDINTFWVSRMLMAGLDLLGDVPFRVVLNHGLVRDAHGKKMSKSFGNVIDPLDLIEQYGADALRFALLRAATPGVDIPIAEEWVEGARRFANKLWNAARFVLLNLGGLTPAAGLPDDSQLRLEDRWILSRLEAARAGADEAFAAYDFGKGARLLYHFVWDEYCDWYLELAKLRDDTAAKQVLAHVLDTALRMLHPLMPFVTEEIWRTLNGAADDGTLMRASWPQASGAARDREAEDRFAALQQTATALRRFRADHGLSPAAKLNVEAVAHDTTARTLLEAGLEGIKQLSGVGQWTFAPAAPADEPVGKVSVDAAELFIPLIGLIDLDEERRRVRRELDKARSEAERARGKLANTGFVAKAPTEVVDAERAKLADWETASATLESQLAGLGGDG